MHKYEINQLEQTIDSDKINFVIITIHYFQFKLRVPVIWLRKQNAKHKKRQTPLKWDNFLHLR